METNLYNIGQAAKASGISAKMIRHYEEVGLIPKTPRSFSGYRVYNDKNIHTLRFIKHARNLGFSIKQIDNLLSLWQDKSRSSADVKSLAHEHIQTLELKIRELNTMKSTLENLVSCCQGDNRPECPILDKLAQNTL
jgi:MerR family transcriptional regulator, copper efflux regulator